eukprot:281228_1
MNLAPSVVGTLTKKELINLLHANNQIVPLTRNNDKPWLINAVLQYQRTQAAAKDQNQNMDNGNNEQKANADSSENVSDGNLQQSTNQSPKCSLCDRPCDQSYVCAVCEQYWCQLCAFNSNASDDIWVCNGECQKWFCNDDCMKRNESEDGMHSYCDDCFDPITNKACPMCHEKGYTELRCAHPRCGHYSPGYCHPGGLCCGEIWCMKCDGDDYPDETVNTTSDEDNYDE